MARTAYRLCVDRVGGDDPADIDLPAAHFICQARLGDDVLMVPDERFFDNPLVTGLPNIRFYADKQARHTPDSQA